MSGIVGGSAFLPTDIAGLKIWCKADGNLTKDGGDLVSAWGETGGSLIQVTQGVGSKQPQWLADGGGSLNAIEFDGTDDFMSSAAFATDGSFSFFWVGYFENTAEMTWTHGFSAAENAYFYNTSTTLFSEISRGASFRSIRQETVDLSGTTYQAWRQECDATHASHKIYLNAAERTMGDGAHTNNPSASIDDQCCIGAFKETALYLTGRIREVLCYTSKLSSDDTATVESYLNDGWGVY